MLKLQQRILREIRANLVFVNLLVIRDEFDQPLSWNLRVFLHAVLRLDRAERMLKLVVVDIHHHAAEHVDEAAIRVVGEARIARALRETFDSLVGEAEVENGVHHARHRNGGA